MDGAATDPLMYNDAEHIASSNDHEYVRNGHTSKEQELHRLVRMLLKRGKKIDSDFHSGLAKAKLIAQNQVTYPEEHYHGTKDEPGLRQDGGAAEAVLHLCAGTLAEMGKSSAFVANAGERKILMDMASEL